jgi:molybdopterin/thiamine biosynthesis adenylyltransferase
MDDAALLRYSRHVLLEELGVDAQERFARSHALVIGLGGLGAPAAHFLAAAGVGTLTLCDPDRVDLTNLQRQILYATSDVGTLKADAATARLQAINPEVRIDARAERVDEESLGPLVAASDVVLDCSDNFATRHAVNRACLRARKPLVSGAAIRFDGQVAVFDARAADTRATTACSAKATISRKSAAPPWACSRHWWASSAPRRRRKRSSFSQAPASRSRAGCSCSTH